MQNYHFDMTGCRVGGAVETSGPDVKEGFYGCIAFPQDCSLHSCHGGSSPSPMVVWRVHSDLYLPSMLVHDTLVRPKIIFARPYFSGTMFQISDIWYKNANSSIWNGQNRHLNFFIWLFCVFHTKVLRYKESGFHCRDKVWDRQANVGRKINSKINWNYPHKDT